MANNQYVNKVVYGNQTLIDLTNDSVDSYALLEGYTAHKRTGEIITGALQTKSPQAGFNNGYLEINLPYGLYNGYMHFETITIPIPSSGTNAITIKVPNGTLTPSSSNEEDWIPITIEVDSQGNSNITDSQLQSAEVVKF